MRIFVRLTSCCLSSQRFEVAKMLREQKTYLEIAEKTGASTATISRVNRSLNYGNDGYDMVFERIDKKKNAGAVHACPAFLIRTFVLVNLLFEQKVRLMIFSIITFFK